MKRSRALTRRGSFGPLGVLLVLAISQGPKNSPQEGAGKHGNLKIETGKRGEGRGLYRRGRPEKRKHWFMIQRSKKRRKEKARGPRAKRKQAGKGTEEGEKKKLRNREKGRLKHGTRGREGTRRVGRGERAQNRRKQAGKRRDEGEKLKRNLEQSKLKQG